MNALAQATRVVFALDCTASVLWFLNSLLIVGFGCWDQILVHVTVGVHFGVQTVAFAFLLDDEAEHPLEIDEASRTPTRLLPRRFPVAWIVASIYALLGDFSLLAYDAHNYQTLVLTDACRGVLQYELLIESAVTLIALVSIFWFAALNIERRIKRQRHALAGLQREQPARPPPLTEQQVVKILDSHLRKRNII